MTQKTLCATQHKTVTGLIQSEELTRETLTAAKHVFNVRLITEEEEGSTLSSGDSYGC